MPTISPASVCLVIVADLSCDSPATGSGAWVLMRAELGEFGQAEVQHLDAVLRGDDHIPRFQIAVHNSGSACGGQSVGDFDGILQSLFQGQRGTGDDLVQHPAGDVFHGDEFEAVGGTEIVDGRDVRVI